MSDINFEGKKGTNAAAGSNPTDLVIFSQLASAVGAVALEVDGVATGTIKLTTLAFATTGFVLAYVKTVKDIFYLDRTSTLTSDNITIVTALGGTGRWIRLMTPSIFWATQATWFIDPAGTNTTPGNDEADGLTSSTPIKSIAEWRRRIKGAQYGATGYPSVVKINVLSSSTVLDDGFMHGYTCVGTTANVILVSVPTVIGSGTITGSVAYSGNNRGTVTDSALPVSWTASYGLSSTSGSRYIRKTAGGFQAILLPVETTPKTVMIGLPTDTSETSTSAPTANAATISNGDAYQVVSRLQWPQIVSGYAARVQVQCLDITPQGFIGSFATLNRYVLCGFLAPYTATCGNVLAYNCLFASTVVGQPSMVLGPFACSFLGTCEMIGPTDWAGTENVFVGAGKLDNHHGGLMEGLGTIHAFDNTTTVVNLDRGASVANGSIVGSGNTGKLVTVNNGSYYYPGTSITATTSDTLPYVVAGTSYTAPTVDARVGCGIYNGTEQVLVPDATDPQGAVPLHQAQALAGGSALSVANEVALAALSVTGLPTGTCVWVATYRCFWMLDKATTRTAIPNRVRATSSTGWWIRLLEQGDPFWQTQTVWWIDPAGITGNDEADGLTSGTPIKSIAEWRRRINGATFTSDVIIHALSGSTVEDDGMFTGFTTPDLAIYVRVLGTPTTIGVSGTISSYQAYSGNLRGQFNDSGIPTSWTASNAISTGTGSKWVRRTGTGLRHYAHLIKDLGSKTVQFGIVVDWDETDAINVRTTETNFTNGDTYEVVSLPTWPAPQAYSGNVRLQCFDVLGLVPPQDLFPLNYSQVRFVLCGFPQNIACPRSNGALYYSSVFCMPAPGGFTADLGTVGWFNCSVCNTAIIQLNSSGQSWNTLSNVFAVGELRIWHGCNVGSLGSIRYFDCTTPLISVRHMSTCKVNGAIVGSGNTGTLVQCDTSGILSGASLITATTSATPIYSINGVSYSTPTVDMSTGDAVYG